jgi:histone H3/H4
MSDLLIVKAKVKDACSGMSVSGDFPDVLNDKVNELVKKAVWRAKENGRRTVMGRDL